MGSFQMIDGMPFTEAFWNATIDCISVKFGRSDLLHKLPNQMQQHVHDLAAGGMDHGGIKGSLKDYRAPLLLSWFFTGGWTIPIAEGQVEIEEELCKVTTKVASASDQYVAALQALRGRMNNDLASISSSATKAVAELSKVNVAMNNLQKDMTSENMRLAIANAERLASALLSISELQNHSITFAVLDKKTKT